jgi:hypothetical protein
MANTPQNYVENLRRRQVTPLYDTFIHAAGALGPVIQLFTHTAAADGINVTNMVRANQLPGTEAFTMRALRIVPLAVTEADWILILKAYIVRFTRGRAVELEAGLEYFTAGAGMVTPTALSTNVSNGVADPRAIASLEPNPIVIEGNDQFDVQLVGPSGATAAAAVWIRAYLDGDFDKGVQ